MREMVDAAMERIIQVINTLADQPVDGCANADPGWVRSLAEPLPQSSGDLASLLDFVFDEAVPRSLNPISPGFMGYIPGGGLFHAAVADLISDTLNRYVGVAAVAPVLTQLEANVVRWFCEIVGYPSRARGFLTTGGSLANLSAVITARQVRLGEDFSRGTIYLSDQAHHCVEKAARLAGLPRRNIRILPTDSTLRLDPGQVLSALRRDREQGLQPFMLVASAGTTNAGAIDPLPVLADLASAERLWLHVDAAYGGFFCLTERGRRALAGIERADSIVLDPHKTLFLPYGTGALLVRDGNDLKATHSSQADYMPPLQGDEELVDFCELSPELTRPFRGLRVWLPFKLHGADVFRAYLDEKLDLARWIAGELARIPELEILAEPELSVTAFAMRGEEPLEARNAATRRLLALINERQRVHLTGTFLHGRFAIRVAVVAFRVHMPHMKILLEDILLALDRSRSASEYD